MPVMRQLPGLQKPSHGEANAKRLFQWKNISTYYCNYGAFNVSDPTWHGHNDVVRMEELEIGILMRMMGMLCFSTSSNSYSSFRRFDRFLETKLPWP